MDKNLADRTTRITIAATPEKSRLPAFGRDIVIKPEVLSDYCFQSLDARVDDLLHIAAAVAFADKTVPRHLSTAWRRRIELKIPLRDPSFWDQPYIKSPLCDCLDFLTGDLWTMTFSGGRQPLVVNPQAPLQLRSQSIVAMPFSDGLDSLAAARLHAADHPADTLVLVTSGSKRDADRAFRIKTLNGRRHRVAVPFSLPKSKRFRHVEPTYRSRGFVFNVMVAAAAYLLEARHVIVPESGQGSLGPSLTPVGNEAPDMRMHPAFTRRLTLLLERVLGRSIPFEHPHLWQTKGQTLERLRREKLDEGWWETRSCARDQRHVRLEGHTRIQCGVCAACLLRRQSLHASGIESSRETYLWPNLGAPRLQEAGAQGGRMATKNDINQAYCAVLASEDLAQLSQRIGAEDVISLAALEVAEARGESIQTVTHNIMKLLEQHRTEWDGFLAQQGPRSFLADWAGMAR